MTMRRTTRTTQHITTQHTGKSEPGGSGSGAPAPMRGSSRNKDRQQSQSQSLEEAAGAAAAAGAAVGAGPAEPPRNGTGLVEAVAAMASGKGFAPRAGLCKAVLALVAEARAECAYPNVCEPEAEEEEEGEGEEGEAEEEEEV
jgi:hypothetical protein